MISKLVSRSEQGYGMVVLRPLHQASARSDHEDMSTSNISETDGDAAHRPYLSRFMPSFMVEAL